MNTDEVGKRQPRHLTASHDTTLNWLRGQVFKPVH